MKKLITKNIIIILFCFILPQIIIFFLDRSYIVLSFSDSVRNILNYVALLVPFFASIYLIFLNYKFLKQNELGRKMWPIIFIIFSGIVFFYSIGILMLLYGFRHGIGF